MPPVTEMLAPVRRPSGVPWMLLGGLAAGALAIAILIFAQHANPKYVSVAFGALAMVVLLPLVGDVRLFCLYAIVLLAPIGLRLSFLVYPHMGGASAIFVEALDPFMLLLLYYQVRDRLRGNRSAYRFPPTFAIWGAMIALGVGSVILMQSLRLTASNEVIRMLKLLLLAALIVNEVTTRRHFRHVVIALTIGVILQSSLALTQYLRGSQIGLGFLGEASDQDIKNLSDATLVTGEFVNRVSALLGHANLLAAYLALLLPMAIALLLAPVSRLFKLLLVAALLVGQPALVLTLSRTGWIDFLVALAITVSLGILHPASRKKFLLARAAIVTLTVVVAVALSPMIIKRLYATDPNAVVYRIKWMKTARAMILDNPVFGVGLNTYVFAQLPYAEEKTPIEMHDFYGDLWPVVHNTWMLTWAEQGTAGMLLFIALHISVIAVAVRNLRIRDPMLHALNVGLLAGFVGMMIDGLASFAVRQESPARMFWIVLALILAIGYWRRANEKGEVPLAKPLPSPGDDAAATGRWLPARESLLR